MKLSLLLKKVVRKINHRAPTIEEYRLKGVKIGSKVIIGAGSVVTKDIPDNSVAVGSPARVIGTYDAYLEKTKQQFASKPIWDTHYSQKTDAEKAQMREVLSESGYGFDV